MNDPALARQRRTALRLSWLAYATYYLGRKAFSVIKKTLEREHGVSVAGLGGIDTAFLAAYALGQFPSGVVGDRVGSRRLVGYGMLLSALACVAFGYSSGALAFGACFVVNGFAQSTGWPGTTSVVAAWTTPDRRGSVMGKWSTCYQAGGMVATQSAGYLAASFGWRSAMFVPAVVLALVGVLVLVRLPASPALAVSEVASADGAPEDVRSASAAARERVHKAQRAVLRNPVLWLYGSSYFFIKLVRYALLLWLPYYLSTAQGYGTQKAANVSLAFDAGGLVGVVFIGWLADRAGRLGRSGLCVLSIALLVPVLGVYATLSLGSVLADVALLALVGALLFGPDSLLSGVAAQDAGGPDAAAAATGLVNGIGSFGAVLQGLLIPPIAEHFGWSALFPALAVLALGAVLALLPTLRFTRSR